MQVSPQSRSPFNIFRNPVRQPSTQAEIEKPSSTKATTTSYQALETEQTQATKDFFYGILSGQHTDPQQMLDDAPAALKHYCQQQGVDLQELLQGIKHTLSLEREDQVTNYPKPYRLAGHVAYAEVSNAGTNEGVLLSNLRSTIAVQVSA